MNVHNTLTSAVEGKRGRERWEGELLINLRKGPVPHRLLINDRFFSGSLTIFLLASFINGKT